MTTARKISDYIDTHAVAIADVEAVVLGDIRYTYAELKNAVDRCALALVRSGIKKGDRVATLDTPHPDFFITFLAAASIGAIWVGLNPKYQLDEYDYVINDASPKLLFSRSQIFDRDFERDLTELRERHEQLENLIILNGDPVVAGGMAFEEFIGDERGELDWRELAVARELVSPDDPAMIIYTSGTTGTPKGAIIPHRGLSRVANVQLGYWDASPLRTLNFLPINHIGCVGDIACFTFVGGGTIVFMEKFEGEACLRLLQDERITCWMSVPTTFQICLAHPQFANYDLSAIQLIIWGGACAPTDLIKGLLQICPRLSTSFGQTESVGSVTFVEPCDDVDILSKSVGQPVPEYDVRIVDEDGNSVPTGENGEIQVRGDFVTMGYWNNPRATADAFDGDWLKTGDLAHQDADGHVHLTGRLKEMFISGGYNVFPLEIEQVLESHPAVAMAAVVSVPDELFSEVGHAWIMREPGHGVEAEDLTNYCKAKLANYKVPKRFLVRDDLPTLPIGKLDRRALKAESAKLLA